MIFSLWDPGSRSLYFYVNSGCQDVESFVIVVMLGFLASTACFLVSFWVSVVARFVL
jgi:hypothetical protein